MPEPRTCHLPASATLFCTSIRRPGQVKALQHQYPDTVLSSRIELGGRR